MLQQALDATHSTIFFGNIGRHPSHLEFEWNRIWGMGSIQENDPGEPTWIEYQNQSFYLWIEPEFGARLDSRYKYIVFTSHLDLQFEAKCTRIVPYHLHVSPVHQTPVHVFVNTNNPHTAYLGILCWSEMCDYISFSIRPDVKQKMNHSLKRSKLEMYVKDQNLLDLYLLHTMNESYGPGK